MTFLYLKEFYRFLLENHTDDLVEQNVFLLRKANLPILQYFSHLPEHEFFNLIKDRLERFLQSFVDERALEEAIITIDNWKKNKIQEVKRNQVTSDDIVQVYSIRKQVFVNLLCVYTDDPSKMIAIFKELVEFHSFIEKQAIDALMEITHEELSKTVEELQSSRNEFQTLNINLQEHKEELQTLNEELSATNEELSVSNEELYAANEELQLANEEQLKYISEIEKVKEELRASRDYYLTLLHDFPALIWRCNLEAKCDYFNYTWMKFTGRSIKQEYGDGWTEGVHPDDLEESYNTFVQAFDGRKPFERVYRLRRHDGKYRFVVDYGKPIYGLNKEFQGFLGVCFDVTEQKVLAEELERTNTQLRKSNEVLHNTQSLLQESYTKLEEKVLERTKDLSKAKEEISLLLESEKEAHKEVNKRKNELKIINTQLKDKNDELSKINVDLDNFIYTASHDLKAPVINIEGLMLLLKKQLDGKIDTDDGKILEMMNFSIQKFKKTILDLTDITKAQKGYDDALESLSLSTVLAEVKSDIKMMVENSGAEIHTDLEVNEVYYSPHNLRSIFYNLISNAIKYKSPDRRPSIKISSRLEDDFIVITFKDNGLGISKLHQTKLFTMFKRFHTHVEGTGIGLYVVKRILQNNKGKIEVESIEGEGTIFKVYIKQKFAKKRNKKVVK